MHENNIFLYFFENFVFYIFFPLFKIIIIIIINCGLDCPALMGLFPIPFQMGRELNPAQRGSELIQSPSAEEDDA
jgi:hypothetical protein